jgi:hypothetical protein
LQQGASLAAEEEEIDRARDEAEDFGDWHFLRWPFLSLFLNSFYFYRLSRRENGSSRKFRSQHSRRQQQQSQFLFIWATSSIHSSIEWHFPLRL